MDILPCSRVGHIFRKRRPYGNIESHQGTDTLSWNSLRVAKVWMDEYIVSVDRYWYSSPSLIKPKCGQIVAFLERWLLVRGRSNDL